MQTGFIAATGAALPTISVILATRRLPARVGAGCGWTLSGQVCIHKPAVSCYHRDYNQRILKISLTPDNTRVGNAEMAIVITSSLTPSGAVPSTKLPNGR